jgi:hypothetical protein
MIGQLVEITGHSRPSFQFLVSILPCPLRDAVTVELDEGVEES